MKKILFACLLIAISVRSFAQWNQNSSTYLTTTNNVGIGSTVPSSPLSSLSVNPSSTAAAGGSPATSFMVGSGSTVLPNTPGAYLYPFELNHTYASGHSGKLQFATYRRFTANNGSEWYGAAYRLQYTYDVTGANGSNAYLEIGESDPNYIGNGFISLGTGGVDRLSIGTNGNIGIGTTNPSTHSGYTGLSTNNATNGGFLEFLQSGLLKGYLCGDSGGLTLYAPASNAVHVYSNATENMTVLSNGNVGINQTAPVTTLQVMGGVVVGGTNANIDPSIPSRSPTYLANTGQMLMGWNRTAGSGETDFISNQGGGTAGGFAFYNHDNNNNETQLMWIQGSNGNVLIGTPPQANTSYKLNVTGNVRASAITVNTTGADFVFKPTYRLLPLDDLKKYVDKNHHLPEIASAKEMQANGLNLGNNQTKLLQKVEELTLYTIASDQQIKEEKLLIEKQQELLLQMQKQLEKQQKEIELLKNK